MSNVKVAQDFMRRTLVTLAPEADVMDGEGVFLRPLASFVLERVDVCRIPFSSAKK